MKLRIVAAIIGFAAFATVHAGPAAADADDKAWIAKCIKDNADQGQSADVVKSYCTCMNDKMSSSETESITTWEKTHKKEADECSAQAGWK